jgi:hypothetical protein
MSIGKHNNGESGGFFVTVPRHEWQDFHSIDRRNHGLVIASLGLIHALPMARGELRNST